jgi:hypothetical protein
MQHPQFKKASILQDTPTTTGDCSCSRDAAGSEVARLRRENQKLRELLIEANEYLDRMPHREIENKIAKFLSQNDEHTDASR